MSGSQDWCLKILNAATQKQSIKTMTFVSDSHIILTPTQPVASGHGYQTHNLMTKSHMLYPLSYHTPDYVTSIGNPFMALFHLLPSAFLQHLQYETIVPFPMSSFPLYASATIPIWHSCCYQMFQLFFSNRMAIKLLALS